MKREAETNVAFTHGKLIDGTGADPTEDSLVLIKGQKIEYAGPYKKVPQEYVERNISEKTIMPGLIDSHVHFTGNESDDDTQWVLDDPTEKTVIAVQQARDAVESGLTTVGEISRSGVAIRNTINAGIIRGPRMVCTGLGFCRTSGHGDSHKLPLDYNNASHPWAQRVDGPWNLRHAVRNRLRENVDAIKIWATGGGIWRHDDKLLQHYTQEEINAVVDECRMVHIPVWSHAEGYEGALASAKAGVHLIIHGQTLNEECLDIMAEKESTSAQPFSSWNSGSRHILRSTTRNKTSTPVKLGRNANWRACTTTCGKRTQKESPWLLVRTRSAPHSLRTGRR